MKDGKKCQGTGEYRTHIKIDSLDKHHDAMKYIFELFGEENVLRVDFTLIKHDTKERSGL
jgi:hypothetical protein